MQTWVFAGIAYTGMVMATAMASGGLPDGLLSRFSALDSLGVRKTRALVTWQTNVPVQTPASPSAPAMPDPAAEARSTSRPAGPIYVRRSASNAFTASLASTADGRSRTAALAANAVAVAALTNNRGEPSYRGTTVAISAADSMATVTPVVSSRALLDVQFADASWRTPRIDGGWSDAASIGFSFLATDVGRDEISDVTSADTSSGEVPAARPNIAPAEVDTVVRAGTTLLLYETVVDTDMGDRLIPPPNAGIIFHAVPEPTSLLSLALLSCLLRRNRRDSAS